MDENDTLKSMLKGTEAIINAGRRLGEALREKTGQPSAVTAIEQAVEHYDGIATNYQKFKFSQINTIQDLDKATSTQLTEDVLASLLLDLQVANVLMVAGSAVGEMDRSAETEDLDDALNRLGSTRRTIEQSLTRALDGRFGFTATAASEPSQSPDLASAIESFKNQADEAIQAIVVGAGTVVKKGIIAISKLDPIEALKGLVHLGETPDRLEKTGRLFRYGIEKLNGAVESLINLFGNDAFKQIREKVQELWNEFAKGGEYVGRTLEFLFGVEATRAMVSKAAAMKSSDRDVFDLASGDLAALATRFKGNMEIASGLVSAVTYGSIFLVFTPLAGPPLALFAASVYFLIVGAVLLIGDDYADSHDIINRVRGVRQITASVAPKGV
jgi:hypothetical protein